MDERQLARLIEAMHGTIQAHVVQLDALDEAIGDGDHGTNLARAFAALSRERARLGGLPLGQALAESAATLEREAGGAGGRYYAAFCRGMGEAAPPSGSPGGADLAAMLDSGVAAVRAEGRAGKGEKTLLDVLIPVAQGVRNQLAVDPAGVGARIVAAAAHGLHSTTHMVAKHGLAADLGVASVNRIDPGACSCALLLGAAVGALERSDAAA
jgi:phosphoenolpyruvate---glycerone phosphotransferase subunit DhaL